MPSIRPRAAAARAAPRPSVVCRKLGSSAVGTSWPRSESRLAAPIARTPGRNQRCSSGPALRQWRLDGEPARLDEGLGLADNPDAEPAAAGQRQAEASE